MGSEQRDHQQQQGKSPQVQEEGQGAKGEMPFPLPRPFHPRCHPEGAVHAGVGLPISQGNLAAFGEASYTDDSNVWQGDTKTNHSDFIPGLYMDYILPLNPGTFIHLCFTF